MAYLAGSVGGGKDYAGADGGHVVILLLCLINYIIITYDDDDVVSTIVSIAMHREDFHHCESVKRRGERGADVCDREGVVGVCHFPYVTRLLCCASYSLSFELFRRWQT